MHECILTSTGKMHICSMHKCKAAPTLLGMARSWQIRYVDHVLAETGMKASSLAAKARFASTTLTRAMNSPDHKYELSLSTVEKIQAATGIAYAPFLASPGQTAQSDPLTDAVLARLSELSDEDRAVLLSVAEGLIARRNAASR